MTAGVGPVLSAGEEARAVIRAICDLNPDTQVIDRGSYLRILTPSRCLLLRSEVEKHLARPFFLPGDLEKIMPSFAGHFAVTGEKAIWSESP